MFRAGLLLIIMLMLIGCWQDRFCQQPVSIEA